ncbi:hypothetical protein Dimus_029952 [Dionaea muscipula]
MASLTTPLKATHLSKPSTPSRNSQLRSVSKVRVVVKVRPFPARGNASENCQPVSCVSVLDSLSESRTEAVVQLKDQETGRSDCYMLDGFFGPEESSTAENFTKEVIPLIHGIFLGCNGTIFAYGATNSGKTYTMQGTDEHPGLMPQAMSTILSLCKTTGYMAKVSYYEVYMDSCNDLLELKTNEIAVLDDDEGNVHLKGLSQVPVNSMSEFHDVFNHGIQRRKVAHTGLNDVSSRSHAVLVIAVAAPSADGVGATIAGKLNLIDLAGNEDNRRACNEGIRLQESAKNNQSLLALFNVIYALNNKRSHVPYRESKLTRILQDSLGGTSRALMVACLNPGEYQDSLHTVSIAARSRHASNFFSSAQKQEKPIDKVDMEAKLRAWLELKGKTKSTQRIGAFGSPPFAKTPGSFSSLRKQDRPLTSMNGKITCQKASTGNDSLAPTSHRILSHSEAPSETDTEDFSLQNFVDDKDYLSATAVCPTNSDDERPCSDSMTPVSDHCQVWLPSTCPDQAAVLDSSSCLTGKVVHASPLRGALSPLNLNITNTSYDEFSSKYQVISKNTPFVSTREKFQDFGTPLDKFSIRSSSLKGSLAEEYIDFLNTANREELMELKGIGVKRAEYILKLRQISPLKSLSDLEKIGLSSKQVDQMFSAAARGLF